MNAIVNKWLKIVQQITKVCLPLSTQCVLCLQPSCTEIALCEPCEKTLPWIVDACERCGIAVNVGQTLCAQCLGKNPPFGRLSAPFEYAWPINAFISKLKYGGHLPFGRMLGYLLSKHFTCIHPIDTIVAIPLHPLRQKERGFNQCIELGWQVAKQLNLPLDKRSCTKIIDTPSQALLSASRRSNNLNEKAFCISPDFAAKHVLVIEDVVTTGTTINAFTRALKQHGVRTVEILSVCRTSH